MQIHHSKQVGSLLTVVALVATLLGVPTSPASARQDPPLQLTAWKISGNTGVGGVTLSYYDSGLKTATSGNDGSYNLLVPDGWGGVVTPSLAGYTFLPGNRNYSSIPVTGDITGQDYSPSLITYLLSVSKTGSGSVTSSPSGINCGLDCSESYNYNIPVTLTAAAATGFTFTGWSDSGCPGTGTCTITMSAAKSVTANFNLNTYLLTVSKTGNGSGTVTSEPGGITCGSDCSETYNYNTFVVLTATAATGSTFTGWSDSGCPGTGTCTITMSAAKSVTATFTQICYTLIRAHTGSGDDPTTLPTNSSGCSSGKYHYGESISLTANPTAGWAVGSWVGTNYDVDTSTMNSMSMPPSDWTVTANYVLSPVTYTVYLPLVIR